jgi:hypothetical protein
MPIAKLAFTASLAVLSALTFWWLCHRGRKDLLRHLALAGMIGKVIGVLLLYTFVPDHNQNSDAALHYLRETLELLDGKLPYRDFHTSYSPLFHVLLAPFVAVWPSVGAIVLAMVLLESGLIALYFWRCRKREEEDLWCVVYIYTFSPISAYWTLTGYNGVVISFFTLIALILAERKHDLMAGISAALGLLFSKLLMVLSWPAIVFVHGYRWHRRASPLLVILAFLGIVYASGMDVLQPISREIGKSTSGNLWFLLAPLISTIREAAWFSVLPIIAFGATLLPLFVKYLRTSITQKDQIFDSGAAFFSVTCLLFMIVSMKSYSFYLQMAFLFIVHSVSRQPSMLMRALPAITYLGAVATIEPHLYLRLARPLLPIYDSPFYIALWIIDLVVVTCYVYLLFLCYRTLVLTREKKSKARLMPPICQADCN